MLTHIVSIISCLVIASHKLNFKTCLAVITPVASAEHIPIINISCPVIYNPITSVSGFRSRTVFQSVNLSELHSNP